MSLCCLVVGCTCDQIYPWGRYSIPWLGPKENMNQEGKHALCGKEMSHEGNTIPQTSHLSVLTHMLGRPRMSLAAGCLEAHLIVVQVVG